MITTNQKTTHLEVNSWVHLTEETDDEPPLCNFEGTLKNLIYNTFIDYSPTTFVKFSLDALKESKKSYLKIEIYNIDREIIKSEMTDIFNEMMSVYGNISFSQKLSKK